MKTVSRFAPALAAAALLMCSVPALADTTPGWYVGGGVGATITPDAVTSVPTGDRTANFEPGWNIEGAGGYAFNNGLRTEAEIFHSHATVGGLNGATGSGGSLSNTDFFVNGLYDFNLGSRWTPYVGVGIGAGLPEATHLGTLTNGGAFNDEDLQVAYQGIVGVSAQVDTNWAFTADYRYIGTPDPTFKTTAGGSGTIENASHNILVGLRYSFGKPAPVLARPNAPAPHYTPAKAAEPEEVPQSYMVFFDFNKSGLTAEATKILTKVAADYKAGHYEQIDVTGHTDTVGSEKYNDKLSVRRANVVAAELKKLGVPARAIVTNGVGKQGLLVPTADGVREAQNRRAEVVFKSE